MEDSKIGFPEVVGKVLAELTVYDDEINGREVLLRFTDETQLSIAVSVRQSIDARYCFEDTPDKPIFVRQD